MSTEGIVIAVDTREQKPYEFGAAAVVTLQAGDYSIVGLEDRVAIERKSKSDAYSSLGRDRARFRREVERLAVLDYAAIVVEDTMSGFLTRPPYSQMNPKAALSTLLAWSIRYGVPVFFAGDRDHGQALTQKLLTLFWKYREEVCRERAS